jgi:Fusaric acid resistance protein family
LQSARTLSPAPVHVDNADQHQPEGALDRVHGSSLRAHLLAGLADAQTRGRDVESDASAWTVGELQRRDEEVHQNLLAVRSVRWPPRSWRAPLYRSYRTAAESGVRAALWFAIASTFFVWAGWPAASVSLSLVAVIIGLGAITPNPRGFTTIALVGAPIATVFAGILEFMILDGADDFPLLAMALAPFTIGAALLTTSQTLLLSGLGRINLIFIMAILAPSNPQTYNSQSFLFASVFVIAAAAILLVAQTLIPPLSDEQLRKRLVAAALGELQQANRLNGRATEEATFRDAARIRHFLSAGGAQDDAALAKMLSCFDQSAMIRHCDAKLAQFADGPLAPLVHQARAAIVKRDTATLRAIARRWRETASYKNSIEADVAACLVLTSDIIDQAISLKRQPDGAHL